jgi:YcxB-like protein
MSDNVKATMFLICLYLGLPIAILLAGDWLRRKRFAKKYPPAANEKDVFHLPYSIEFISTREDLVQAFEAERTATSGMRRAVRWCIVGMGWLWLAGAVCFWTKASRSQLIIWLSLGVAIIWSNVMKPFFKRWRIRTTAPASQKLGVEITEDGIHIEADGGGAFSRTWDELDGVIDCDEGILVYFTDRIVNWLPRRVFTDSKTKAELYSYMRQRLLNAENEN